MKIRQQFSVLVLIAAFAGISRAQITGEAVYVGTAPKMKAINMMAMPEAAKLHNEPVLLETIVVGPKNELKNVVVAIIDKGLVGKVPEATATIDQVGAVFVPHVIAVMVGQKFEVKNSDPFMHNIRTYGSKNEELTFSQPAATATDISEKGNKAPERYKMVCSAHPWMVAWVHVFDHPFFAVTGSDGKFSIDSTGLKDGEYSLEAWSEKVGMQTVKVTLKDGKAGPLKLEFKPKSAQ